MHLCYKYALFCLYNNVIRRSFVHISSGHERDGFEITPVISLNIEHVCVAVLARLCSISFGFSLSYTEENSGNFQACREDQK